MTTEKMKELLSAKDEKITIEYNPAPMKSVSRYTKLSHHFQIDMVDGLLWE